MVVIVGGKEFVCHRQIAFVPNFFNRRRTIVLFTSDMGCSPFEKFEIYLRMKRVGLALCGLELLASWVCKPVRRTGGWAPREWRKRSRGTTTLLALDAELGFQSNCARTRVQDSRLKRRNLGPSLFPENVGVKENRKILLCKTSGAALSGQNCAGITWLRPREIT